MRSFVVQGVRILYEDDEDVKRIKDHLFGIEWDMKNGMWVHDPEVDHYIAFRDPDWGFGMLLAGEALY